MNYVKLKCQLLCTDIDRTIVVPDSWTLLKLHRAMQAAFDWEEMHLWFFTAPERKEQVAILKYWDPDCLPDAGYKLLSAGKCKIKDYLPKRGSKLIYEYDTGDGWEVCITRMADPSTKKIACVKANGVDAIEDIGGPGRLMEFIDSLTEYEDNPKSRKNLMADECFREMFEWAGCDDHDTLIYLISEPEEDLVTMRMTELWKLK